MAIELLTEGAYRSYLEPTAEAGIEASHLARVCFSDGEIRRVYIKFYPESNHGLVNEITGHLLAAAIGLPVPQHAAVIFVPKIALPACPAWANSLRELLAPQTHTPDYRRRLARESCAYHGEALIQVSEHLLDWWVSLLDDAERQAAAEFLGNRAQDHHICARYQMQRL